MEQAATRMFWWGTGLFLVAIIAFTVGTTTAYQATLVSDPIGQPTYYWVVSPLVSLIQACAFPLGAALIAASLVTRHINRWVVPPAHDDQHTEYPE